MDLTGKQLASKYQLQEELGRGGMGIVYRAYDSRLRRQVAIKVLAPQLAGDPLFVERFQREAIAAGNLHHSNIVTIYDVGTEPEAGDRGQDVHYIVMQYVKGESLHQWLRKQRRPMPLADTTAIVRQIGDALQYAHDRGMVHRDVKPANVMLDDEGHVTLMDFGLVRAGEMSQLTQSGSVLGTPAYMAPEQITGAVVDRRTDVYAFGVMIYELLVGEAPFVRTTPMAVAHAHVYDPPPPLREKRPDLSSEVELVVRKALAKEPTARFADASSLTRAFAAATTGEPERLTLPAGAPVNAGQTQRPPASEPVAKPGRGRPGPALWVVAILGVLALGAAAVLALRAPGDASRTANPPIIEATTSDTPTLRPEATSTATAPAIAETPTRPPDATSTSVAPTSTSISKPPTATPDLSPVLQAAGVDAVNLRVGPGTEYARVGQLRPGDALDIVGRTADSGWWQVCCIEGEPAWIASNLVQASGSVEGVPVVTAVPAPPTSTALPTTIVIRGIPLEGVANARTSYGYVNPPNGSVTFGDVPFQLNQGASSTTQASSLPENPTIVIVPVEVDSPHAVYLLLTGGNLFAEYSGQNIGEVRLLFDDGADFVVNLTAGRNVREWKLYDNSVIRTTSDPNVSEVWRGANQFDTGEAIIDMLRIDVPQDLQRRRLTSIQVADTSLEQVGSMDPALNLLGISVAAGASTAASPSPTNTPAACYVSPGPTFAQPWDRQQLGCPTTSETGVTSAYEAFERGWMLWRKDTDGIYAIFDDGSYQVFFYPSDEPPQFSCPEAQRLDRPQRGFGMAWCSNADVRSRIGNALDYEIGDSRPIQDFERGFMLFVPERGHVYAMHNDGTWEQRD